MKKTFFNRVLAASLTALGISLSASAQTVEPQETSAPTAITDIPTDSDNGKLYIIMATDTERGGLYAETDNHKVGSFGYNDSHVGSGREEMEMNADDANQQFAILKYRDHFYLYSIADCRFVSADGETPILVDEAIQMTVSTQSGGGKTGIAFRLVADNKLINLSWYQAYHGAKTISASYDGGNLMTIYDTHKTMTDEQLQAAMDKILEKYGPPAPPTAIESVPTETDNGKIYVIMATDTDRGGLYAETDNHKVGSFGYEDSRVGSGRETMEMNSEDPHQQFAIIKYADNFYLYSVADNRFVGANGTTPILVDEAKKMTVSRQSGSGYTGIAFRLVAGNELLNLSWYQAYHGAKTISASYDGGNLMTVYDTHLTLSDEQMAHAMLRIRQLVESEFANAHAGVIGYPSDAARQTFLSAVSSATTVAAINTARTAFITSADIILPENGKAYSIKARYANGDYRYITHNGTRVHISAVNTKPTDGSDVFVVKYTGDNTATLFNAKHGHLVYYADGKKTYGDINSGYSPSYAIGENNADLTLHHLSNSYNSGVTAEQLFGTISIQGYNANDNGMFQLLAGDSNFHNTQRTEYHFTNTRSSFFEFEEVEQHPLTVTAIGYDNSLENIMLHVFPYPFVANVDAYFISAAQDAQSRAAEGNAVLKTLAKAGTAIPANTPVIMFAENSTLTLAPATTEAVASIPEGFSNLLTVANDETEGFVMGDDGTFTSGTVPTGGIFLNVPTANTSGTYVLDNTRVSTSIHEIEGANAAATTIYDLQGRRLTAPVKGLNIINGQKVLIK